MIRARKREKGDRSQELERQSQEILFPRVDQLAIGEGLGYNQEDMNNLCCFLAGTDEFWTVHYQLSLRVAWYPLSYQV